MCFTVRHENNNDESKGKNGYYYDQAMIIINTNVICNQHVTIILFAWQLMTGLVRVFKFILFLLN